MDLMKMTGYYGYLKKNYSKRILIYGAGIVAYYFSYELIKNEEFRQCFAGFAVQRPEYDVSDYWGIPIRRISEYDENKEEYCLIIATKENVWNEIEDYLKDHGWNDYYLLLPDEYMQIRNKYPQLIEGEYIIGQFERIRTTFRRLENSVYQVSRIVNRMLFDSVEKYDYSSNGTDEARYLSEIRKFRCRNTYTQIVKDLLFGLPTQSVEIVSQILDRLNRLCDNQPILYSLEEKEELKKIEDQFDAKKYKISDSWYMYKDYKLPIDHFEECVFWYEHGIGMLEDPDKIKNKCLIDAGGFIGDSALVFSRNWKGNIYSFEADPKNFNYLKETIRINNLKNVIPVNMALTDKIEMIGLYKTEAMSCNTIERECVFSELKEDLIQVQGMTVDRFVEEHGLSIGLIKTDVEGAESRLLEGAKKTIKSQRPALIISIYHSMEDFFFIKKQIENLDAGYQFRIFRPVLKTSFLLETCLICEVV